MNNKQKAYLPVFSAPNQPQPHSLNHFIHMCEPPSSPVDFAVESLLRTPAHHAFSPSFSSPCLPKGKERRLAGSIHLDGALARIGPVNVGELRWVVEDPTGVLPPFSRFLVGVLSHYQIHVLHLDPNSLVLLSSFTFLCEAFVGITPSMEFLRHFFSLELVSEEQCSGCVSLKMANASIPGALNAELLPKAEGVQAAVGADQNCRGRSLVPSPVGPRYTEPGVDA
ncbi:hypothetical protein D1007_42316 [Hordeum vulgare]|nr:hypothetical protein D1007_42316 [Hordeum vulgare]